MARISDAGEQRKTVCAEFGLAMYIAQCLEHGLVGALIFLELFPQQDKTVVRTRDEWNAIYDAFTDRQFRKPLGELIKKMQDLTAIPPEIESQLADAPQLRNRLAHRYFREHAEEFDTAEGCDGMIRELREARAVLERADDLVGQYIAPISRKYGITDEQLDRC